MRRVALLVIMFLMLGACTSTTPPPPNASKTPPASTPTEAPPQPINEKPQDPPSPPPAEPEKIRLNFHVAASKDGPWQPYSPFIHVDGSEIWVKIEANQPFPPNLLERFTNQFIFTPGIQGEQPSDRVVLLWRKGPVIRFSPDVALPEGSSLPDVVAFAGAPPEVQEWDPITGQIKTLVSLKDLPSTYTKTKLDPGNQTLTYTAWLQNKAVEISLKTGESRSALEATWPARVPAAHPYRLKPKPGQSMAPDAKYSAQVTTGGDPPKVILDLPDLQTITPFNPCLPFDTYHAFAPDGSRLAVATMESPGKVALLLLDLSTGSRKPLLTRSSDNGLGASVSWSPDGKWIVFHDALLEVATAQVAAKPVGRISYWRPDGKYLALADEYLFHGWGPLRVVTPGQETVHLEADGRFIAWTTEGRLLYFDWPNGRNIPIGPRDCV